MEVRDKEETDAAMLKSKDICKVDPVIVSEEGLGMGWHLRNLRDTKKV